ncbi:hypothetical protein EBR96_05095, partial [bacterium]|nr:hypothetical protein [bacterium]
MRPAVRPESPKGIDAGSSVSPSMPGSAVSGTPPHSPIIDELLRQRVTEVFSAVPLIASEADSGAAGSVDISPFQYAARSPIVRADPSRTETAATQLLSFIKRYGAPVQHMMLPDRSVVTLGMALGQGAFGTVRHGFISNASYSSIEHAAVKFVALRSHSRTGAESDATYQANAEIEYQNYRTFDGHPNFVQCLGAYRVTDDLSKRPSSEVDQDIYPVAMVLELAGPSLASELGRMPRLPMPHVSSEAGPVPVLVGNDTVALARFDGQMIAKFQSLLTAGCAMVEAGKVHQDIKPGNILVGNDGCLKVADFGGMRDIDSDTGMAPNSSQTSPLYASYEQLSYKPLTSKSDVFSMGRVFYEMLTGVRWVKEMPSPDHFDLSKCSGHLALLDHVPGITTGMKDLLVRMMAKDPADRPTFEEASLALTALTQPERLAAEVIPTPETVAPPPPRPQEPPPKAVGARFTSGLGGRPVKPRYEKSPTVPFAGKGAEGTKVPKGGAGGATVVRFDAASGEIVPTELVVNEKLGAGHFSTVKRGTWIDELGSADVAIKRAKGASDVWAANRTMAEMAAEFEIIQLFDDDPRCVQVFMLGHYEGEKGTPHPILVMERGIGTLKIADGGLNPEKAL